MPKVIDDKVDKALRVAIEKHGSQSSFAKACGVNQSSISQYLSGFSTIITDQSWKKLEPFLDLDGLGEINHEELPLDEQIFLELYNNLTDAQKKKAHAFLRKYAN